MAIETDSNSRFLETEAIIFNGIETFGLWQRPDFLDPDKLNEEDIISVIVEGPQAGRPDVIADILYGSQLLDWVIVMFNKPKNTLGWPSVGDVIRAPSASVVTQNI